jgi:hypothetical protein
MNPLALLAHFSGDGARTVAVIEVYLDESGTHRGAGVLTVGGFYGNHSQWAAFLKEWPHSEFNACESKYDGLKPQLWDAIDAAALNGLEVSMRPQDFAEHVSHTFKSIAGNTYAIGAYVCAGQMVRLIQANDPDARVALVIESGQPNVEWVQKMLLYMMSEGEPIASVTVVNKRDFPQLHAADMLCHSRSTSDAVWLDRMFASQRIHEVRITWDVWQSLNADVEAVVRRHRGNKVKERRQRSKSNEKDVCVQEIR